jgi:hypothetical protein
VCLRSPEGLRVVAKTLTGEQHGYGRLDEVCKRSAAGKGKGKDSGVKDFQPKDRLGTSSHGSSAGGFEIHLT